MTPREARQARQAAQRARPALVSGAGVGTTVSAGGSGGSVDANVPFLAEITAASGLGIDAVYAFEERHVVGRGAGGITARVGGRLNTVTENPARYAGGGSLAAGDLVLVRRNVGDVNEYEIIAFLGPAGSAGSSGGGNGASFCFTVHRNPRCEDGRLVYDEHTICLYGAVFGEEL